MSDTLPDLQLPPYIHATAQLDELKAASLNFLINAKACFGEHSSQLDYIHNTLGAFKSRKLSKRDAHASIFNTLDGHDDLKRQLMDLLMLPAAGWHPDDFDLPMEQPMPSFVGSTPQYLQPAHEPQMRLPSLSSNWFTIPQAEYSAGHLMSNGFNDLMVSSPTSPVPASSHEPQPPFATWAGHSEMNLYPAPDDEIPIPPLVHVAFRDPWQIQGYPDTWDNDITEFSKDNVYNGELFDAEISPDASQDRQPQLPVVCDQNAELYQMPNYHQHDSLLPIRSPQFFSSLLPSLTAGDAATNVSGREDARMDTQPSQFPLSTSPPDITGTQDMEDSRNTSLADQGHLQTGFFIHALCGKGFSTLSGVKKHHWGKRLNDFATTTGCWAKHKKPDAAWDDHPSCKDNRSTSETNNNITAMSGVAQSRALAPEAEPSPNLHVPHLNTVPGFPTLKNLPHTVARALNTATGTTSGLEEREPIDHTYEFPSRSSFEDLLTAVNLVSQIDAPKPQTRSDSIALHLDAQVAATERHSPFVPYISPINDTRPQRVRSNAPFAVKSAHPGLERLTSPVSSGHAWKGESEKQSPSLSSRVEKSFVSPLVAQPSKPVQLPSSGPAKKKRKTQASSKTSVA